MEYPIKQLADHRSPAPQRGAGGQGAGGEAAASARAKELRQPRGGGGQVRPPPAPAERRPTAPRQAPQSAPHRGGEARARAGTRPAAGGDPRQRHDKHARDRDQGGAGGQQTATAHTSRGDLRTRPHTAEVLTRLRDKTTVPGAPAALSAAGRDPVRPRIVKNTRGRYQPPSPHRCICSSHGFQMNPRSVYRSATYSTQAWQTSAGCIMSYSGRRVPCATA